MKGEALEQLSFWAMAANHPNDLALVEDDGTELSFAELARRARQIVHGLRELGLSRGDGIATVLENEAAVFETFFAAAQAGMYVTPINPKLAPPEIAYIVDNCEAKAVFVAHSAADVVGRALAASKIPSAARFVTGTEDASGFQNYASFRDRQGTGIAPDRASGTMMTYTSGTTGRPKGVRRALPTDTPEEMGAKYTGMLQLFGLRPRDHNVHIVGSPLYHTAVLSFATNHLHLGHSVVLMKRWDAEAMLAKIEKYRVTCSHMVPTQFNRLLAMPEGKKRKYDLSSLRCMVHSAAPCPVPIKWDMLAWWGDVIYEYYAASEGGGTLATPSDWKRKPGTVGKRWPFSEIQIRGEQGEVLGHDQIGTVYMKMGEGRPFEYFKDGSKTEEAFQSDYFTVGDAGYLDDEGFLFLCDRKADMIISGGVNIYPAEVEGVLVTHPKVRDVAVFGIPHEDWGEEVKAVIELEPGVAAGAELTHDILDYCKERLAKYKWPKTIDYVDTLPREENGKLYKRKLRDPYWAAKARAI
jgi:long-chain acyl-CoA synthetase